MSLKESLCINVTWEPVSSNPSSLTPSIVTRIVGHWPTNVSGVLFTSAPVTPDPRTSAAGWTSLKVVAKEQPPYKILQHGQLAYTEDIALPCLSLSLGELYRRCSLRECVGNCVGNVAGCSSGLIFSYKFLCQSFDLEVQIFHQFLFQLIHPIILWSRWCASLINRQTVYVRLRIPILCIQQQCLFANTSKVVIWIMHLPSRPGRVVPHVGPAAADLVEPNLRGYHLGRVTAVCSKVLLILQSKQAQFHLVSESS